MSTTMRRCVRASVAKPSSSSCGLRKASRNMISATKFRRGILALIAWVLMTGVALADSGWFWQNPLPQGNGLSGVAVVNTNTVFAVGAGGTILKSVDGGVNWMLQSSRSYTSLNGVSCTDVNNCTSVGFTYAPLPAAGTILRTTN